MSLVRLGSRKNLVAAAHFVLGRLVFAPQARAALVRGENGIAVRCKQTSGGPYVDVGLVLSE